VVWTDDPAADLRNALAMLDEETRKAIRQYGAPPPWPLTPGTPRHVIDAARRLMAATADPTPQTACPTCNGKREIQSWDSGGSWWAACPDCAADPTPQTDTDR
jgi:hypothetical protein